MSQPRDPAGSDDARGPTPDRVVPPMTFIVRVSETARGVIGVVEHPATGRKERFHGIEAIGQVIAGLRAGTRGPDVEVGPAGTPGDSRAPPTGWGGPRAQGIEGEDSA